MRFSYNVSMEEVCIEEISVRLEIGESDFEKIGDSSIEGFLFESLGFSGKKFNDVKRVVLVFPQTTLNWKKQNKGPKEFIIYEHTIPSILCSILNLRNKGIEINILTPES
jgi:hypothetical protein